MMTVRSSSPSEKMSLIEPRLAPATTSGSIVKVV
jgi:hypothetical protein